MTTGLGKGQSPQGRIPRRTDAPYRRVAPIRTVGSLLTVALGMALGGCSLVPALDGLALDPAPTGSVAGQPAAVQPVAYAERSAPTGVAPDDWVAARQALAIALRDKQAAPSIPWSNPVRQSNGTVTPVGESRVTADGTCRDFLVSIIRGGASQDADWLQGSACHTGRGGWQVDQARLLARS